MSSRLRYPGSKFKAGRDLMSLAPLSFGEWRDPFCGSAAMLWHVPTTVPRWINDLSDITLGYFSALRDEDDFIDRLLEYGKNQTATELHDAFRRARWLWSQTSDPAAYWFLNQYSYGQFVRRGRKNFATFSYHHIRHAAFPLTRKDAERFRVILQAVRITCGDYRQLIDAPGKDVLLFIDPPYYGDSVLYDHEFSFRQHVELRDCLLNCRHRFLLTLSNCELSDRLYRRESPFEVYERDYLYTSMLARPGRVHGKEIVVRNYDDDDRLI